MTRFKSRLTVLLILLAALAMLMCACGGDDPAAPAPRPPSYTLTQFEFHDVQPGIFDVFASSETFQGGPATLTFNDTTVVLQVASDLTVQVVEQLSAASNRQILLAEGTAQANYEAAADGTVTFTGTNLPSLFTLPTILSAASVVQEDRTCYDDPDVCEDFTSISARWERQE